MNKFSVILFGLAVFLYACSSGETVIEDNVQIDGATTPTEVAQPTVDEPPALPEGGDGNELLSELGS